MTTEAIKVLFITAISISLVRTEPQFGEKFDGYKLNGDSREIIRQLSNGHRVKQSTDRYQNNIFLNSQPVRNKDQANVQNQLPNNNRPSLAACESFWSCQSEQNQINGFLSIPQPSHIKSVLRIKLSLAARLPSVSLHKEESAKLNLSFAVDASSQLLEISSD